MCSLRPPELHSDPVLLAAPFWALEAVSPSPALPTLMVPGASHHAWTHPTYPTDQASVVKARGLIRQQVNAWLAEP